MREIRAAIHPEDTDIYESSMREHLRGESDFFSCEFRRRPARGETRWILLRGVGLRDADQLRARQVERVAWVGMPDALDIEAAVSAGVERSSMSAYLKDPSRFCESSRYLRPRSWTSLSTTKPASRASRSACTTVTVTEFF